MAELAAISLAANVLQVIGFTGSVVCKSWEYYGSASGVLQEYEDASVVAANLRALCVKIEGPSQAADAPLFDLAARCHATAKLLIDELDKLVVHGKKSKAQSLRKGLKAVWGKDESEGLAKRVTDLRAELKVYIAGDLRLVAPTETSCHT